jgi:hypothetical protein
MTPFILLNIQSTLSLIVFALIAYWHIVPRLNKLNLEDSLIPLLWVHTFRYTPLTLFAPGQVDPTIPQTPSNAIAYGDLFAGVLALLSIIMLKLRARWALVVVWVFNIVGVLDIMQALFHGISSELYTYSLGFNWYLSNSMTYVTVSATVL